jgi:hypothetical protein
VGTCALRHRTTWNGLMTQPRTWALSKTETDCGRERPKNPTASAVWSFKELVRHGRNHQICLCVSRHKTAYFGTIRSGKAKLVFSQRKRCLPRPQVRSLHERRAAPCQGPGSVSSPSRQPPCQCSLVYSPQPRFFLQSFFFAQSYFQLQTWGSKGGKMPVQSRKDRAWTWKLRRYGSSSCWKRFRP